MDLWSKGLGRLVLHMRLSERQGMDVEQKDLVLRGTMGKPTFWDWSVNLDEGDVVDFIMLLKRPEVVRFLVEDEGRWRFLGAALTGIAAFAWYTLRLVLGGRPRPAASRPGDVSGAAAPAANAAPATNATNATSNSKEARG